MTPQEALQRTEAALLRQVPLGFAKGNLLMPLCRAEGKLWAAVAHEDGLFALRELARRMQLQPQPLWLSPQEVKELINQAYGQLGSAQEVMEDLRDEDLSSVATQFESPTDIMELTEEAPIIRLLNALLKQAVKERASDIHIEPFERELEIRLRVDGMLRKVLSPPKLIQDALVSRVKVMARLDIAERRLPQDGRMRLLIAGRDIDVRVSVLPTIHGERVVMRLLDRRAGLLSMQQLGMDKAVMEAFQALLSRPNGIILVTGPTGSGKTTTLYAALRRVHSEDKNIITVEDPVEYELKGVGQMQVNPRVGLTFASGLRAILRQDPDVVMVGEIRDLETAQIATQASLTGHLVLSTLHTNDAAGAITRLLDIGVEPYLVASSLLGVLAQRLLRLLCPECKEPYPAQEAEAQYVKARQLYRPRGCPRCGHTGYLGRTGVFELLLISPAVRELIVAKADAKAIHAQALQEGLVPLREHALTKVSQGLTSLQEALRVVQKEHAQV